MRPAHIKLVRHLPQLPHDRAEPLLTLGQLASSDEVRSEGSHDRVAAVQRVSRRLCMTSLHDEHNMMEQQSAPHSSGDYGEVQAMAQPWQAKIRGIVHGTRVTS